MAAKGARVAGLKKFTQEAGPAFTSKRRIIWAVTVVPTLAPSTTPMDWRSVSSPEPTRPEVSTMVAVELWITAVTSSPKRKPMMGVLVTFSSPSPIRRIP